jgi:hypothetical protein
VTIEEFLQELRSNSDQWKLTQSVGCDRMLIRNQYNLCPIQSVHKKKFKDSGFLGFYQQGEALGLSHSDTWEIVNAADQAGALYNLEIRSKLEKLVK